LEYSNRSLNTKRKKEIKRKSLIQIKLLWFQTQIG
jgi:hypothetical protein